MTLDSNTALAKFIATIARLRAPDGCPWDREQTHETLARYLLEETYEVLEAIHLGDPEKLKEELGDLLLQIALNAQVAKDSGHFDIQDVAQAINNKMIKRHPHVFADAKVDSASDVRMAWEDLKEREKGEKGEKGSALDGVTPTLPALLQALKISEKAVRQGFEWRNQDEVWEKLLSELDELKAEIKSGGKREDIHLELGDVLFTIVNVARWQDLNPEESLLLAIDKFKQRFHHMEKQTDRPLKELSADELEALWVQAKAHLAASK
jgi:MazG family protein